MSSACDFFYADTHACLVSKVQQTSQKKRFTKQTFHQKKSRNRSTKQVFTKKHSPRKRSTKQAFTKKGSPCRYIFCFWVGFRNCFPRKSEAVRKSKVLSQDLCIAYMSRISETVRKSQTSARIFRIFWLVRKSQSLSMNVPKTCLTHGP